MSQEPKGASPGPWRWDERAFCPGWLVDANGWFVVSPKEPAEVDVSEADAALIARAPEMASMLRQLGDVDNPEGGCRMCGFVAEHRTGCPLAALLRELP